MEKEIIIPEKDFWNKKYSEGGISGKGSIGKYRRWKWEKMYQVFGPFKSVVDVGCGDLSFWKHPMAKKIMKYKDFKYTGIDISDHIISRNRKLAPELDFICSPSHILQEITKVEVSLCMDLLFHIMEQGRFELTLENLCKYSHEWIVIYNWKRNPFELQGVVTDGVSQYFRKLGDYRHVFDMNSFELVCCFDVPFDVLGRLYFLRSLLY